MKNKPFHSLNRRAVGAAAVTAALLVPLGVFGGPALARSTSVASSGPAQYQYKISVCHRTHSKKHPWVLIRVSSRSWPAHQRHGDLLVPPSTCPPTAAPTTAAGSPGNGKGNGNGNGNNGSGNNGKGHGK
jgi:hypothetical protein